MVECSRCRKVQSWTEGSLSGLVSRPIYSGGERKGKKKGIRKKRISLFTTETTSYFHLRFTIPEPLRLVTKANNLHVLKDLGPNVSG